MDVSKDLARDFHLERFTKQEFHADHERQNMTPDKRPWAQACAWQVVSWKYSSPTFKAFPVLLECQRLCQGRLQCKHALTPFDQFQKTSVNELEDGHHRTVQDWLWPFRKSSIQLLPAWSTESVPSNWYLSEHYELLALQNPKAGREWNSMKQLQPSSFPPFKFKWSWKANTKSSYVAPFPVCSSGFALVCWALYRMFSRSQCLSNLSFNLLDQVGVFNLSACTCLHKLLVSVSVVFCSTKIELTKIAMSRPNQKEPKQAHVVRLHGPQSLLPVLLYWHLLCKELNLLEDLIIAQMANWNANSQEIERPSSK